MLTGGAQSLGAASSPLLPARGWRLSLLAISLIVIMTPVATILRKINLHSHPHISTALAPHPARLGRILPAGPPAAPEVEIRRHWRGPWGTGTAHGGPACALPQQPGEPGDLGAGHDARSDPNLPPSCPLWDTPSILGCVRGKPQACSPICLLALSF